jgi:hypothetical protein
MARMFTVNKLFRISGLLVAVCLLSFFPLSACAQMQAKLSNEALLMDWKNIENSTV